MTAGGLGLEAHPLRRAFQASAADTLVAVLLKLRPDGAAAPLPLDLALVLDAGQAMAAERGLETALQAARQALDGARPEDRVAIVAFAERARVILPLEPVGDGTRARRTLAFLDHQPMGDRSDLAEAMRTTAEVLAPARTTGRAGRALIVAGGPTVREPDGEREARLLAGKGVGLSVAGVGHGWNGPLLARLADAGRGELWHAPRPADLQAVVREEVALARHLAYGEALLHLKLSAGVRPRRVLRVFPGLAHWLPSQPSEREAVVRLGDLPGDRPTYVLLELVVGPQAPGTYRLAQADVRWRAARSAGRVARTDPAEVVVAFGAEPGPAHAEAAYYVDRVQGYALVEKALEARREADAARAQALLGNALRIAAGRKSRIAAPLEAAIGELAQTGLLAEGQAKALLLEARQPE
jgi:Ca-activated chloride channel family protein